MEGASGDNFRPEFKRYKKKSPPPCFKEVLDTDSDGHEKMLYRFQIPQEDDTKQTRSEAASFGLKNPSEWQCYGTHEFPGFQFIRNPFLPGAQRYWVKRCLADYPCKPNVTNLDTHHHPDQLCNPWQTRRKKDSSQSQKTRDKTVMDQLRWVTLGYHYDWDNKVYNEDQYSPFPEDLGLMTALIAEVLGYPRFQAQAGIVNFYHMDSTLGGHTDHSEFDLTAPLISYSLGQSAIFLVGGTTKATKPMALHLRSGDVIVLGGASRLAYHAVPRIMYAYKEGQLPRCFDLTDDLHQQESEEEEYVTGSTLNVGDHTAQENIEDLCDETCKAAVDADIKDIGKLSDSVASSATGNQRPNNNLALRGSQHGMNDQCNETCNAAIDADFEHRPKNALEHCPYNSSPDEPCERLGSCIKRTSVTDTVSASRTNPSNSADPCITDISEVSKNIPSAIRSLSREDLWKEFEEYLKHGRINISVRQVTGPGKGFPEKERRGESDGDLVHSSDAKRTKVNSK
ncbi:nucleic acid dioxygenase ALKBH1-like [Lytechinus variegatus]|uniref:nucleic acid dioxygenase ALKBH1-like n=1 Tax=Lytechinus variegatus TaxID=7654 RepID=UPI001BB1BDC1|nr:nucleic acid dioxygenase ALKBH1-like [Lytechinus variegatus]